MLPAVFLTVLTAARVYGFNSCLEQRSSCLRNPSCRRIFESFEHTCGYSLTRCSAKSPSDCVNDIRKIRDFFPFATCVCYETIGFTEECDYFRQLIWNHPCERKLTDAGIERRLLESQIPSAFTVGPQLRRTTRTPLSDQVRQWKSQLNGDLETRERISQGTCDHALNHVCLRHVSCRQLWKLFRSSCGVDQENQCTMADREVCWQSFEGLSWTGLGSCRCDSDNSDCHWIRLHTNYNKCIYEISKSGQFPRLTSLRSQQNAQQYQRRYETEYRAPGRVAPTLAPTRAPTTTRRTTTSTSTTTTTTPRPTTTTTTSTTSTTTTTQRPTTTTRYIPVPTRRPVPVTSRPTTVPSWWNRPANNQPATTRDTRWGITAQIHYRPLFEELPKSDPVTTAVPNYYHYTTVTTPTPWWITPSPTIDHYHSSYRYPANSRSRDRSDFRQADSRTRYNQEQGSTTSRRIEFPVKFAPRTPARVSTCQSATAKCEQTETCRWHLGELRVRCARVNCRRDECAAALQRFSRYVPFELVESIMFCECEANDSECARQQELMYPKCLYTSTKAVPTCTQNVRKCEDEPRCRHNLLSISRNCPVVNGECSSRNMNECRKSLLAARASVLEQPCFCRFSDVECISQQRKMIPNNPCIEKAMLDYSNTAYSTNRSPSVLHTNRINTHHQKQEMKRDETERVHYGSSNERSRYNYKHQTSTSTTPVPTKGSVMLRPRKPTRTRYRTTSRPPSTTEAPPPWVTTTPGPPTTTTTFMTHAPPPPEGCQSRDAHGKPIFVHLGTVMRRYVDWSSRCSSWCECVSEDNLVCDRLPCLEEGKCQAPLTTIDFGERIFLKERGACFCESGKFICDLPSEMPEMYPGLYIAAGYSPSDVAMLRKEVPPKIQEKAGLLSSDAAKDIASRLQIAFELLLPEDLQCRIVLLPEMSEMGSAFLRVEWFGQNEALNHTKTQWHHGWAEKVCSPYVQKLSNMFSEGESLRYQLVLSTVKQIKVLDYLDGLPKSTSYKLSFLSCIFILLLLL